MVWTVRIFFHFVFSLIHQNKKNDKKKKCRRPMHDVDVYIDLIGGNNTQYKLLKKKGMQKKTSPLISLKIRLSSEYSNKPGCSNTLFTRGHIIRCDDLFDLCFIFAYLWIVYILSNSSIRIRSHLIFDVHLSRSFLSNVYLIGLHGGSETSHQVQ